MFRTTQFDPMDGQQLRRNDPNVDFAGMEQNLAKEMARMKIVDEKKKREIEKICGSSEELKELQLKIKSAYLNKERAAQMTENQYRRQIDLVSIIHILTINFSKNNLKSKPRCCAETNTVSLHKKQRREKFL